MESSNEIIKVYQTSLCKSLLLVLGAIFACCGCFILALRFSIEPPLAINFDIAFRLMIMALGLYCLLFWIENLFLKELVVTKDSIIKRWYLFGEREVVRKDLDCEMRSGNVIVINDLNKKIFITKFVLGFTLKNFNVNEFIRILKENNLYKEKKWVF